MLYKSTFYLLTYLLTSKITGWSGNYASPCIVKMGDYYWHSTAVNACRQTPVDGSVDEAIMLYKFLRDKLTRGGGKKTRRARRGIGDSRAREKSRLTSYKSYATILTERAAETRLDRKRRLGTGRRTDDLRRTMTRDRHQSRCGNRIRTIGDDAAVSAGLRRPR